MRGAADFMISLTPVDDLIHLESSKQRNAAPFEKLVLKLVPMPDGDGCVLRLADEVHGSPELTQTQRKVLGCSPTRSGPTGQRRRNGEAPAAMSPSEVSIGPSRCWRKRDSSSRSARTTGSRPGGTDDLPKRQKRPWQCFAGLPPTATHCQRFAIGKHWLCHGLPRHRPYCRH